MSLNSGGRLVSATSANTSSEGAKRADHRGVCQFRKTAAHATWRVTAKVQSTSERGRSEVDCTLTLLVNAAVWRAGNKAWFAGFVKGDCDVDDPIIRSVRREFS